VVASVFDVIIINRYNLKIGIGDHVMYMMGDNMIYQVAYMLVSRAPALMRECMPTCVGFRHSGGTCDMTSIAPYCTFPSQDWMPVIVLTSKLCPAGIESTMYALLAGFQNFGQSIARSVGSFLIASMGIVATAGDDGEPCNWE